MIDAAQEEFYAGRDSSDPNWGSPRFDSIDDRMSRGEAGYFPELFYNLVISLSASGMGVGVYKLIDLWVKAKNGRKIHVKLPDGLVVDATQMTHEEFSEFLSEVYEVYNRHGDQKRLGLYVKAKRIKTVNDEEKGKLVSQVRRAVEAKGEEIAKRGGVG